MSLRNLHAAWTRTSLLTKMAVNAVLLVVLFGLAPTLILTKDETPSRNETVLTERGWRLMRSPPDEHGVICYWWENARSEMRCVRVTP